MKTVRIATLLLFALCSASAQVRYKQYGFVPQSPQQMQLQAGSAALLPLNPASVTFRVHVEASGPVTVFFVNQYAWNQYTAWRAQGRDATVQVWCQRPGIMRADVDCMPTAPGPFIAVAQDERGAGAAILAALGVLAHSAAGLQQIAAGNDVVMQNFEWNCVADCDAADAPTPEQLARKPYFGWKRLSKEQFDLLPVVKQYGPFTPEGEARWQFKVKSDVPLAVTVVAADDVADIRSEFAARRFDGLEGPCLYRNVQKQELTCQLSADDGPLVILVAPEAELVPQGKRAQRASVEVSAFGCKHNCDLLASK